MAQKAHVTSIETLDKLRVALLIFIEKATLVLDEVSEEVKRTRIWLQVEQGPLIARMQKQRMKELDMFQQELYTARMSALNETKTGVPATGEQKAEAAARSGGQDANGEKIHPQF